jgi:hypothetical protein
MSTGRKGLERLSAPRGSAATHGAGRSSASVPRAAAIDTRGPSFMLKPAGFFDRHPALDVPAPGGDCYAEAS